MVDDSEMASGSPRREKAACWRGRKACPRIDRKIMRVDAEVPDLTVMITARAFERAASLDRASRLQDARRDEYKYPAKTCKYSRWTYQFMCALLRSQTYTKSG